MAVRTFAAIDVGSFELELGIYEMTYKTGIRRIDHVRHVIALGKDTYSTGKISYELVEEMCQVLEEFVQIMKSYKVKDYRAYATSARFKKIADFFIFAKALAFIRFCVLASSGACTDTMSEVVSNVSKSTLS